MKCKPYALPKRFPCALSEKSYKNLRALNVRYLFSNNYLLTVLLENLNEITVAAKLEKPFLDFTEEYGAPEGEMLKREDQ